MAIIAATFGLLFAILFGLNSIFQSLRGSFRAGPWSTVFLFFAVAFPAGGYTIDANNQASITRLPMYVNLVSVAVLVWASIICLLLDYKKQGYSWTVSKGILGVVGSALIVAVMFYIPIIPSQIFPPLTPTSVLQVALDNVQSEVQLVGTSPAPTQSQATAAPTQTRTPLPQPSPTRTRRSIEYPTVTPTFFEPTQAVDCEAAVLFNLNMRERPDPESDVLLVIPFETVVYLTAVSDNNEWWQTTYRNQTGWLSREFISLSPNCTISE